jgi:hypothetical protein
LLLNEIKARGLDYLEESTCTDSTQYNGQCPEELSDQAKFLEQTFQSSTPFGFEASGEEVEVKQFLEEKIKMKTDILEWWKLNAEKYKRLAPIARDYLSVPATSVPSESVFSHAKFELDGKERMKDETFQAKMELREWLKWLDKA